MSSQPLSNCHRTFLEIKETFHTLAVTSTPSLCLSLNKTDTHAHFILKGGKKKKNQSAIWGLSKDTPPNKLNYIQPPAHPLSKQTLFSVNAVGKNRGVAC